MNLKNLSIVKVISVDIIGENLNNNNTYEQN
jgi:hypothetical protein